MAGLGFAHEAAMVSFPIDPFLVGSDVSPIGARATEFVAGLLDWRAETTTTGVHTPPSLRIEANGYEAALEQMNHAFLRNTWGDGLPVVAPTREKVDWILRGTDRAPEEILGKFLPKGGLATVETTAVSLAMAGGRPEYLPVLLAAVEAVLDPALEHDKWQATSGSSFPIVVVNGPIAKEIRLNSGFGLLGPDPQHPAGASIGRALRLLQQNVGGALPGVGTMAIFGAMRYTNAVFAEDEDGLPEGWAPLSGAAGSNTVTVFVSSSATNIVRRGVGKEAPLEEAAQSLHRVAEFMRSPSVHAVTGHAEGTPGALLIPRIVARQLHALGWTSKETVKRFLWDHAKIPQEVVKQTGLHQWIEASSHAVTRASANDDPWSLCVDPDQIIVAVAGGEHPTHNFWFQGYSPVVIRRSIEIPKTWPGLVAEADLDLGPGGEHCVIG